jgi:phosphonoacetaldehyde hydrolase
MFRRAYRGPVKAVVFDWAGTTVDYGSFAPTAVFVKVLEQHGVPITVEQARTPMGLMKKDHLRAIVQMESVAREWEHVHGRPCAEEDIEAMFKEFVPLQIECLKDHADVIPGTRDAVRELRSLGIQIGSTTGYTREMMEALVPQARQRGYEPDVWACPSDVPAGRPFPWMCYQNAIRLQVYPMEAMVKLGDTLPDLEEGLNAGMWTIGVTLSGNEFGLTKQQVSALSPETLQTRRQQAYEKMHRAGAHYVVDGIWDCLPAIHEIGERLRQGERP